MEGQVALGDHLKGDRGPGLQLYCGCELVCWTAFSRAGDAPVGVLQVAVQLLHLCFLIPGDLTGVIQFLLFDAAQDECRGVPVQSGIDLKIPLAVMARLAL